MSIAQRESATKQDAANVLRFVSRQELNDRQIARKQFKIKSILDWLLDTPSSTISEFLLDDLIEMIWPSNAICSIPPVPTMNPRDESLLSDEELRHLVRDGKGQLEAMILRMRDDLIFGRCEPAQAVDPISQINGFGVFGSAIAEGRVSAIIYTANRILAFSFWQTDFRFTAWDSFLESLPEVNL